MVVLRDRFTYGKEAKGGKRRGWRWVKWERLLCQKEEGFRKKIACWPKGSRDWRERKKQKETKGHPSSLLNLWELSVTLSSFIKTSASASDILSFQMLCSVTLYSITYQNCPHNSYKRCCWANWVFFVKLRSSLLLRPNLQLYVAGIIGWMIPSDFPPALGHIQIIRDHSKYLSNDFGWAPDISTAISKGLRKDSVAWEIYHTSRGPVRVVVLEYSEPETCDPSKTPEIISVRGSGALERARGGCYLCLKVPSKPVLLVYL